MVASRLTIHRGCGVRGTVLAFCFVAVVAACSTAPKIDSSSVREVQLKVGHEHHKSAPAGYFARIERVKGRDWVVREFSTDPIIGRTGENQEVLYLSRDLEFVQPFFEHIVHRLDDSFECTPLMDSRELYTPCNSALTSVHLTRSVGKNLIAAFTTFGIASGSHKKVDSDAVLHAVRSSGLIEKASLARYRNDFQSAKTSRQLEQFIAAYGSWDPDGLVSEAAKAVPGTRAEEHRVSQQRLAAEARAEADRKRRAEEARRREQERRQVELARISRLRDGLSVGTETNCGPVLEVRSNLVKIYFPVSGYGNEHWLRKNEVFPAGSGCRFVNGRYQPPKAI